MFFYCLSLINVERSSEIEEGLECFEKSLFVNLRDFPLHCQEMVKNKSQISTILSKVFFRSEVFRNPFEIKECGHAIFEEWRIIYYKEMR
jgi:hypothetical protein